MSENPFRLRSSIAAATVVACALVGATPAHAIPTDPAALSSQYLPANPPDDFYTAPTELGTPGSVLKSRGERLVGDGTPLALGNRSTIMYTSTTLHGQPVAVTGTVIEPHARRQGPGPQPTVVFAPGTRGQGDVCAPSRSTEFIGQVQASTGSVNINYEAPAQLEALRSGIRVVVTDYIGLGMPGHHTYVNHTEEGRAVLDAARAALKFAGAPADAPVGLYGYSQGGGAAASAAEQAASYAPELNIKGTYAGAPPADLLTVMEAVDRSAIVGVLGMALNGYMERSPEVRADVYPQLNERGRAFLAGVSEACIPDAAVKWGFWDTRWLTTSGKSFAEMVREIPAAYSMLEGQKLGKDAPKAPIMIHNATHDDLIPHHQALQLARDYAARGATVYFTSNEVPTLAERTGLNHVEAFFSGHVPSMDYLIARFHDQPAPQGGY